MSVRRASIGAIVGGRPAASQPAVVYPTDAGRTIVVAMWNPLALPLALLGAIANLPRLLGSLTRATELLERAITEAQKLSGHAGEVRSLLETALGRTDALNRTGDRMIEELASAREVFAGAMLRIDRLSDQGDRLLTELAAAREELAAARPSAERIAEEAGPMIRAAAEARDQLAASQAELARANDQVARVIEMAQPLDNLTSRVERLASGLRREARESG